MDINAWLEEATKRANIPAEDRKILEGVIAKNTGLQTYLEESGLRQSDYDRNMNKLKTEHAARLQEVADKEAAADRFATQNGEWFNQNNGKFTKATQDLEAARVKEAQLVERMKALATRYGVPEEELNIPVSAAPAAAAAAVPAFDEKRFVNREEAERELRGSLFFQAELDDLVDEHRALFGKGFKKAEFTKKALQVAGTAGNTKKLRDIWEDEFKVADKRKELQDKDVEARIATAVQERETKIRSELQLPAPRPQEQHSPIVSKFTKSAVDPKTDPSRGLRNALSAYSGGKYRQDGGQTA